MHKCERDPAAVLDDLPNLPNKPEVRGETIGAVRDAPGDRDTDGCTRWPEQEPTPTEFNSTHKCERGPAAVLDDLPNADIDWATRPSGQHETHQATVTPMAVLDGPSKSRDQLGKTRCTSVTEAQRLYSTTCPVQT